MEVTDDDAAHRVRDRAQRTVERDELLGQRIGEIGERVPARRVRVTPRLEAGGAQHATEPGHRALAAREAVQENDERLHSRSYSESRSAFLRARYDSSTRSG
jgi:hypothetical protein